MSLQIDTTYPAVLDADRGSVDDRSFPYSRRELVNAMALGLGYSLALAVSLVIAGTARFSLLGSPMVPDWSGLVVILWLIGCYYMKLLPGWGLGAVEEMRRTMLLWTAIFGGTTIVLFLFKAGADTSRLTMAIGFVVSVPLVLLSRILVKGLLIRLRCWGVPVVIYGADQNGLRVQEALSFEKGLGYIPVGFFGDDPGLAGKTLGGLPVLGRSDQATSAAPVAIVAMPGVSGSRITGLLEGPLAGYRRVVIIPDLFEAPSLWVKARDLMGVLGLEITCNLTNPVARFTKRAMDIFMTLITAPIWMPVCGLVALLVWMQDGESPLFVQDRVGMDGRAFRMWKFRTMLPRAEEVLERKLAEDPELMKEWREHYKLKRDPRITTLGVVLRRSSLDELPQLFNVLRGDMSLVGPRPLPEYHYAQLSGRVRRLRDQVRPGITGLWQVSGRSEVGASAMQQWDPYYVRNWSIWLDIVIMVRTIRAVLHGRGAY